MGGLCPDGVGRKQNARLGLFTFVASSSSRTMGARRSFLTVARTCSEPTAHRHLPHGFRRGSYTQQSACATVRVVEGDDSRPAARPRLSPDFWSHPEGESAVDAAVLASTSRVMW